MGGYTRAVSGKRLDKHVTTATDRKGTIEELCFLCCQQLDVISKGQGQLRVSTVRECVKRGL
jgi:hypothetical protein